ncbi:MAG: hypothetical protein WKG07_50135 [Hymenobacter sp.]
MKRILLAGAAALIIVLSVQSNCPAQTAGVMPTIGETKTIIIPVCHIDVRWNGSSSINNTYAAPAGWQIISFTPKVISKKQYASYAFSQTPSNSASMSLAEANEKFNDLLNVSAEAGNKGKYEGKIQQMREDYSRFYQKAFATHSQIVTTGKVKGDDNPLARYPGRLYLDLEVVLAYYPDTQEQFQNSLAVMKEVIQADKTN